MYCMDFPSNVLTGMNIHIVYICSGMIEAENVSLLQYI